MLRYLLIFIALIVLTSCSHAPKKDGPPKRKVNVARIPNAKPKVEPKSKIGNKPYTVFGKRYKVMKSSKDYKEKGTASWYGTKFHNRFTSSGEKYDMLAMTAAHKSLPLPTYVEVKNLRNGKKVIVKVNDRGPFHGKRLIDLSYAAAKKLDIVGNGTAKVEVTAIDPKNFKNRTSILKFWAKNPKPTYLQAGAFQKKINAESLKLKLATKVDHPVYIKKTGWPKSLYKVQIGPIKSDTLASKISDKLKSIGIDTKEIL